MSRAIAVCANFAEEARVVLDGPGFDGVSLARFAPGCGRPPLETEAVAELAPAGRLEVLGAACCAGLPDSFGACTVHRLPQCFHLVAPAALVDHLLAGGAYLVTPQWLRDWRTHLEDRLGLDPATATSMFGESMKKVVLLDTGIDADAPDALREMAAFVGLPAETIPVGLEHLRLRLGELVMRRQLETERAESVAAYARAYRRTADYAATFDVLGALTEITRERQALERALDVFAMLFGPERSTFLSIVNGEPGWVATRPLRSVSTAPLLERLAEAGGRHAVRPDALLIPVRHAGELLGVVELEAVVAPEHLEDDVVLALAIAGVCGLAIANARKYEAIKSAEEALAVEHEQLLVTLRSIGDAVIATDTAGRVTMLNRVAERLTGYAEAEAMGRPLRDVFRIVDERTGAPSSDPVRAVVDSGDVVALDEHTVLIARDGRLLPIADSAAPIRGHDGELRGVVLVFRDVETIREAEREREVSIEFLRLVNGTHGTTDLIRAATKFFQDESGCEAVGTRLETEQDFPYREPAGFSAEFLATDDRLCTQQADGLDCVCGDVICGRVDPQMPFFTENGTFWTNDRGELIATAGADGPSFTRDACARQGFSSMALLPLRVGQERLGLVHLTDRRPGMFTPSAIARWERLAAHLAVGVARARAVESMKAVNAQLVEADRRKNDFLAMLSHELRNPLAPILNSVYILQRTDPHSDQATRARDIIDRQARHIARMTDDLLDLTRISRGKIRLQRERVELGSIVRGSAEDQRETFHRGGIDLHVEACEHPVFVDGDPTRIAQMIGNLLQNSAKFTESGGHTRVALRLDGDEHVTLEVSDDGAGIQPEILERLFEPFVQADRTLDRSRGGLGLGLALVKGLAELHGWTVRAESEGPGKGARFLLRMPLERVVPVAAVSARGSESVRPRRVLLIEDNHDAAYSLKEALECEEHEVEVAFDGPSGIASARAFLPDVIICDIGLPRIDGYRVAETIRADPTLGHVLLVALSGYAAPEDVTRSMNAGFDHHMAKPPDLDALSRLLQSPSPRRGEGLG